MRIVEDTPMSMQGLNSGAVDVEAFLDRANLRTACSFYLSYEMYSPSKPAPNGYRIAAERLHTPPEQCLVFEDSQPGLTAARWVRGPRAWAHTRCIPVFK